ncbi:M10 family metallopeptidase [Enterovirga rhinocerotis]|uniref:Ca2+-binding RTX toxin-like protein n=1 Tax=Enterovirga rhinocerotis TaxID=1339210 RepID=A0A4R7C8A2_9HYPH|nr:M10 family metallopeptidase [Enterovirga rhinocerotis]TDR94850.1 Ca2+-binding RTX toxin-like protein [Enterovirga rhinocerotis]
MVLPDITQSLIDRGLLYSDYYWSGSVITYSIPNGGTSWIPGYEEAAAGASYSEFTAAQAARFVSAIELWDSYIATSLVQVDDGSTYGDIRIAYTDIADVRTWGYAYIPPYAGGSSVKPGDIWVDTANKGSLYAEGSYDYMALLHEIGHTLGLKHPHEWPVLSAEFDSTAYTLMSYNSSFEWRVSFSATGYSYGRVDSATPMVLDIAAIQSRYGADLATAAGTNIYRITDEMTLSRRAIYDAGGTDTIDLSALSRGSRLDMRPGASSDLGYFSKADQIAAAKAAYPGMSSRFIEQAFDNQKYLPYEWTNNLGIAFSTLIEKAVGSRFNDRIFGNEAANTIDGGLGADILYGRQGLDWFHGTIAALDNTTFGDIAPGETITFNDRGATVTRIRQSDPFTEGDVFTEIYVRTSPNGPEQKVKLFGLDTATLFFEGATVTVGGTADDEIFVGRVGNDLYSGGGGGDTVDYSAARGGLRVDLGSTAAQSVGGGFGVDKLLSIWNLIGGAGADRLTGSDAWNEISGGDGADLIAGRGGNDTLIGGAGNDTLDGGTGADAMFGGAGNDIYVVDDISTDTPFFGIVGDTVREDTVAGIDDGGRDLVQASVSFTLGRFVENLTLTGTAAIDGSGNELANVIIGNRGANHLFGFDGDDILDGGAGDDTLRGGAGRDSLTGGAGKDDLDGGEDGDTYYVDGADIVMDSGQSGIDLVVSRGGFVLKTGSGIENLRSVETAANANLTGNELDNAITAYGANNLLYGAAGNDTIRAGAGDDVLRGGLGSDRLWGEQGADTFLFVRGESLAITGRDGADAIFDFATGEDRIDLNIFSGSAPEAAYAEVEFASSGFTALKKAAEAAMTGGVKAVFVAGTTDGWLFWSTNGSDGTADEAVRLMGLNSIAGFDRADLI